MCIRDSATIAQQAGAGVPAGPHTGTHPQQRKIAGAAAEVPDHNQFIVIERGFVSVSCGNRLHLELHMLKSRRDERFPHALDGKKIVLLRLRANKAYRPPDRRVSHRPAELLLGVLAQVRNHAGKEILQPVAPAEHLRTSK